MDTELNDFFEAPGADKAPQYLRVFFSEFVIFRAELAAGSKVLRAQRHEAHRFAGSAAVLGLADLRRCLLGIEEVDNGPVDLGPIYMAWGEAKQKLPMLVAA